MDFMSLTNQLRGLSSVFGGFDSVSFGSVGVKWGGVGMQFWKGAARDESNGTTLVVGDVPATHRPSCLRQSTALHSKR